MSFGHRTQLSARYDALPQPGELSLASYVWIDNRGETLRHKMRTMEFVPERADDLPWWDCSEDLSGQHLNVDIFMQPVRLFRDPFFASNNNKLVLCQTYDYGKRIAGCLSFSINLLI
jgi:glutamine synthetase